MLRRATRRRISSRTTAAPRTGLQRHESQPASIASERSRLEVSAVTATITVSLVRSLPRRTRATLKPLMPGSMRSRTTASGSKRRAFSIPASPSTASITRNPSVASSAAKRSRRSVVSSMMRTRGPLGRADGGPWSDVGGTRAAILRPCLANLRPSISSKKTSAGMPPRDQNATYAAKSAARRGADARSASPRDGAPVTTWWSTRRCADDASRGTLRGPARGVNVDAARWRASPAARSPRRCEAAGAARATRRRPPRARRALAHA